MVTIQLNGKEQVVDAELSIARLLDSLNVPKAGTAVAINETIVPREQHESQRIHAGDRVEIVRAIGGG